MSAGGAPSSAQEPAGPHGTLVHSASLGALVRDRLSSVQRRVLDGDTLRRAAVAIVLEPDADQTSRLLLTRRAHHLRAHAGQWALPGGRCDPGEAAHETARRELEEELAISGGEVLGILDDQPTRSGYAITPVVVWMSQMTQPVAVAEEVRSVHALSLRELDAAEPRWLKPDAGAAAILQMPLLGSTIHAPTGAILLAFRELALRGRHPDLRHVGQPSFI